MTRQYNRRDTATQTPESDGAPENVEPSDSDDKPETTEDAKAGDSSDDSPATGSEKGDTSKAKPKKPKTRAQVARDDADKVRAAQDKATLEGAPTFEVTYPTGFSRYLQGEDEIEVTMSGGSKVWVDVVNDHAQIPQGGRMRALSTQELTDFTRLTGQSFLKLAPPD